MTKKLEMSVLLAAVDKITGPLKKMRQASGITATQLKETQDRVKSLNKQSAQIDGYRKVSRSLGITSNELAKAQKEVKRLALEMQSSQAPAKALVKEYEQARAATVRLNTQHKNLTISQHRQREALRSAGIDTRNLSQHQRTLTADLSQANKQLDQQKRRLQQVSAQQKKLSAAQATYHKTKALQGNMAGAGATAAASGAAALYAGSQVLQPGLDFTAAQSKVQALTRLDKNDPQLIALRKQARELGASTSFTANDVSQGQSFLAMAGFDAKSIKQAMPGMLDLAKANDTDLAVTSDIASNILSGFGLAADQMNRLGDVLTATTTRANVDLTMLGETMKYVAPAARDLGVSVEEAAAMSGLLGNIGIQASQGGTVMRAMLNRLAGQTGPAAAAIEQLGLKTKDSAGNLRAIPDILADVVKATKTMGNADRAAILKTIFGEEAGTGVSELIKQQGDGAITSFTNVLRKSAGENARVAKTMADNAKGDIDTLKSAWEDVGIEIFEGNNGGIRSFIQQITGVVNGIGNWMRVNPELTGTLFKAAAAMAIVAAVGGSITLMLAGILGPMAMLKYSTSILGIKSLPLMGSALTKLGGAFKWVIGGLRALSLALVSTPIGWVILGITALVAAGYLLVTHWDTVKAWMTGFWQTIASLVDSGVIAITNLFNGLPEPIKAVLSGIWETMKTVFSWSPLGLIVSNFSEIMSFFTGLPAKFSSLGEMTMDGLVKGITGKLTEVKETITNAASNAIGWFKDVLGIASPSKVFAVMGDQTMDGLTVGLNRSQQGPLNEVNKLSKQIAGTAFVLGISALPAAAMSNDVTNLPAPIIQNREIIEQLSPAKMSQPEDAVRQVRDEHSVAALSVVPSVNREIIEQLSPAKFSQPEDAVRQVRDEHLAAVLSAVPSANREIIEQLSPAKLSQPEDAARQVRDEHSVAALSAVPSVNREIIEQLSPAKFSQPEDAVRQVRDEHLAAVLSAVPSANREIIEQLSPTKLSQPEDILRQVRDEHSVAALSAVPNANREIIEQLSPAKLSQPEDVVRHVRDEHSVAALSAVPSANREIIEQLLPAKLSQPEDIVRQVREEYLGTSLQAIPDQTRTVRDAYQGADFAVPDAIRLVKEGELPARKAKSDDLTHNGSDLVLNSNGLTHNTVPDRLSAGSAFAQRQAPQPQSVHIDAGIHAPITIHATANMDAQDVARLVGIELEKRDRAQQARLRSSLKDLN
ncbi:phage tail tape measure protein [Shewanella sp. M16]|uniref:Tail tape measure protein n=1 Tax=Shewanella phage vB_SspM_M16-3 TaxID=2866684 RepID=A0AAE8BQ02_9CAUD|nr:phage tail tape measure protein [Shewanella sp. M16]YP_010664502.1 tail tape measure protein [Shewanella phage vB_SspM_M16-3]MBS0044435.1 phage tail tape measure protein [Shewanella sp. M16]QYW06296.1 tail tape measure protein [Shewanella phage vB_SspM_M16-3]